MICPICERTVRAEEALLLQDDAFGDAVLWHVRSERTLNPVAGGHVKSVCGKAGFQVPWTRNGVRA